MLHLFQSRLRRHLDKFGKEWGGIVAERQKEAEAAARRERTQFSRSAIKVSTCQQLTKAQSDPVGAVAHKDEAALLAAVPTETPTVGVDVTAEPVPTVTNYGDSATPDSDVPASLVTHPVAAAQDTRQAQSAVTALDASASVVSRDCQQQSASVQSGAISAASEQEMAAGQCTVKCLCV